MTKPVIAMTKPHNGSNLPWYWRQKLELQDAEWTAKWQHRSDELREFGLPTVEAAETAGAEVLAEIQALDDADWARQLRDDPSLRAAHEAREARLWVSR